MKIFSVTAGLLAAVAIVLTTAWNLGETQATWGLPALVPDDPDIALEAGVAELRSSGRLPSRDALAKANSAASLDPLEDEPLLFAALMETSSKSAMDLLTEARRRDPASREARLILLDRYLREQNTAGAIGEAGALANLLPEAGRKVLSSLVLNVVAAPETRTAAVAALKHSPMRKELVSALAQAGASSYLLLDLIDDLGAIVPASDEAAWAQSVTQALVDQGDLIGARQLWSHFFSVPENTSYIALFDQSFSGRAAPPFGWQITSRPGSIAELEKGGLRIRYEGREPAMFARQLLLLPPGRYRFNYRFAKRSQAPPPNLAWRIDCLGSGTTAFNLSVGETFSFEKDQSPLFVIPSENCPGQWLALAGRPLTVASQRTALIENVSITPVTSP